MGLRWLYWSWAPFEVARAVQVPHSVDRPGTRRVWYAYPRQSRNTVGWTRQPSVVARVLDDGTTQQTLASYNTRGQVTSRTDPLGRTTTYTYAANGRDLLEVRQTTGGANDVLASYGSYTATGQPQTVTDAAGQTTTLTYTAAGEVATVTNARGETTTYAYDGDGAADERDGAGERGDDQLHLRCVRPGKGDTHLFRVSETRPRFAPCKWPGRCVDLCSLLSTSPPSGAQ